MPFFPATATPPGVTDNPINLQLTTVNVAQDLIVAPAGELIRSFELRNEGPGDVFVEADGTATLASTKIKNNEGYTKENVAITKFSFIGSTGKKPTITGVAWSS